MDNPTGIGGEINKWIDLSYDLIEIRFKPGTGFPPGNPYFSSQSSPEEDSIFISFTNGVSLEDRNLNLYPNCVRILSTRFDPH